MSFSARGRGAGQELNNDVGLYTGASSPSLFSSLLSALCAAGHVQANADAASNIAASASQTRIFHRGLSLHRLATYSAAASALASATAALLTSTGRGTSLLSLAARERGSERLPRNAEKPEVARKRTHSDLPYVEVHDLRRQFF